MLKSLLLCVFYFHIVTGNQCYSGWAWSAWEQCSKSCAGGFKARHCLYDTTIENERCNAFCFSGGEFYSGSCHCPPGTIGECCADIQECESGPCKNGGVCKEPQLNMYSCDCPAGTVKPNCDDISECYSSPCKNGGICTEPMLNMYQCTCPPGTTGTNCDDILECNSNPCLSGGTCIEHINGYTCMCPPGTKGDNCEDIHECDSSPCQHGATCVDLITTYKCNCPGRYAGTHCEKDLLGSRDSVCHDAGGHRSCYAIFRVKDTWQGAQDFCKARAGHLAVPDTKEEALFLENYLESMKIRYPDAIFWIGGKKSGTSNPHWVSGHRIQTNRWPFGVNSDVSGTRCMTMDEYYNFEWNVFACDRMSYFICEEQTLFSLNTAPVG